MRKYYWYISTFFRKHGLLVLSTVIVGILLFSLSLPFLSRIFEFKTKKYIGLVGKHTLHSLPRSIQEELSLGLTEVQPDGSVLPSVAERWTTEDDGKTYRFLVRKGLVWHDSKELTPSDISLSLSNVKVETTTNDILFYLDKPFSPFPTLAAQPLLRYVTQPYLLFFKRENVIGLGDYRVSDYKEKSNRLAELTIESNTEQHIYRFYLTEDEAIAGFKRGEVDFLPNFSQTGDVDQWSNVRITRKLDTKNYLAVFFNTQSDLFKMNERRQALNYALPKPEDETRAYGSIDPNSWAYIDVAKPYLFDEERAFERILSPTALPSTPMHFSLTTTPLFSEEAERIKQAWEAFGRKAVERCRQDKEIKDKTLCENVAITVDVAQPGFIDISNFQALLVSQESPSDPDQYALWHSQAPTNFTHYENTRIDSLLERGRQTDETQKRLEVYQDFQQFFSEDAPVIFLNYIHKYDIERK